MFSNEYTVICIPCFLHNSTISFETNFIFKPHEKKLYFSHLFKILLISFFLFSEFINTPTYDFGNNFFIKIAENQSKLEKYFSQVKLKFFINLTTASTFSFSNPLLGFNSILTPIFFCEQKFNTS